MAESDGTFRERGLAIVRESLLIKLALFGVVLVVIGFLRQTGTAAGLIAIYGFGFIALGVGGYLLMAMYKKYTWSRHTKQT